MIRLEAIIVPSLMIGIGLGWMLRALWQAFVVRVALRDAASEFTAVQLVDQRAQLQRRMETLVSERLTDTLSTRSLPSDAVIVESILLQNVDLPDTLDASIAAVQQQHQQTLQREQALLTARAEADRAQAEAEGAARALRIRTEAQADANRALAASLSPAILEQHRIDATWAILHDGGTRVIMVPSTGLTLMNPADLH